MHDVLLVGGSFLASAVEMVEAMTIILAVGITRGWKSAFAGIIAASLALTVIVGALGASLIEYVPLGVLQVTVGILLLIFGMQWLRKAIQRASGLRSMHDEDQIFANNVKGLALTGPFSDSAIDWTGFVVSFKGVFLEGLEVAFIVITFGANSGRVDLAALGAVAAFVIVGGTGAIIHRPLSKVPENAIKHSVGVLLMSFGTFWGAEGVGLSWDLDAAAVLVIALTYWAASLVMIEMLKRGATKAETTASREQVTA
jgi:uncharacterized membrane protein